MKRFLAVAVLFVACKKGSSGSSTSAQVKYEVKTSGVANWTGNYLDATNSATLVQGQTSSDWIVTFTNQVSAPRYLQIQVSVLTPMDPSVPVTAIAIIYVNGKIVKTDTASGYAQQIVDPYSNYLLN
ncbi:hypothetical protein [Dinghuibacter silviterrae]|uniref:Uncharacterized protein n=1 Tax=Dinghuibacter silviterrae TaxID=1539049 RepID=A0A4R8DQQ1_9BACT|nr:hypothetical protein [Dinghuibacter silviterrae]TDW99734.1 hypothetical protein EDB95_0745 [Dinghuibacter silviterrae]